MHGFREHTHSIIYYVILNFWQGLTGVRSLTYLPFGDISILLQEYHEFVTKSSRKSGHKIVENAMMTPKICVLNIFLNFRLAQRGVKNEYLTPFRCYEHLKKGNLHVFRVSKYNFRFSI